MWLVVGRDASLRFRHSGAHGLLWFMVCVGRTATFPGRTLGRLPTAPATRVHGNAEHSWTAPELAEPTRIALGIASQVVQVLDARITVDLHPSLIGVPETRRVDVFPREEAIVQLTIWPSERGEFALGLVYLRWRGALGFAERWGAAALSTEANPGIPKSDPEGKRRSAVLIFYRVLLLFASVSLLLSVSWHPRSAWVRIAEDIALLGTIVLSAWQARRAEITADPAGSASIPQRVRVYPAHEQARGDNEFFLMRARQMERQRRQQRLRGGGREFESLREYQPGDELRAVSWTATARRGKVVTRQFMAERSQQVWAVLDAGRLSRTAFKLRRRDNSVFVGETEAERDEAHRLTVTQLDQAATATTMLAQVVGQSGDKFGMLAYGTGIQQVLPPGTGPNHLRLLIDLLSATRSEPAESDALLAVARLKQLQRRRGLMVWITELADTAGRPALVTAAAELAKRHLVVLVLLKHPELSALANDLPRDRAAMFHAAAATEMEERRRETIAQLERQGVLIVEAAAEEIGVRAVSEYLEVKARGLL